MLLEKREQLETSVKTQAGVSPALAKPYLKPKMRIPITWCSVTSVDSVEGSVMTIGSHVSLTVEILGRVIDNTHPYGRVEVLDG